MPETGYSRSPKIVKGALVQLLQDIIGVIPNIIVFQYNPTTLTRRLTPWDPMAVDQTQRGSQAPTVQPFDIPETFSGFKIELDATDDLEEGKVLAETTGIESRLAALRKLTQASQGLLGDLIESAKSLVGAAEDEARRPTVAPTLLVLGPRLILPVRVKTFSVEETAVLACLLPAARHGDDGPRGAHAGCLPLPGGCRREDRHRRVQLHPTAGGRPGGAECRQQRRRDPGAAAVLRVGKETCMATFDKKSRYVLNATTYVTTDRRGRTVTALTPAERPAQAHLGDHRRKDGQRLDHLANFYLQDPFGFWRLAEHNDAVLPDALADVDVVRIPRRT